jgi:ABC-type transport system involved in cytochrome c biogenesis permease subunit
MWNSYWNWDPRQTSIVLLLLVYGAYTGLRAAIEDPERRATLSAAYALIALVLYRETVAWGGDDHDHPEEMSCPTT